MLAFSSGQALRKHLISIHKLNTCDLPPKKRGKRAFDGIEHQSIPVDNKAFKQSSRSSPSSEIEGPVPTPVPKHDTQIVFPGVLCAPFSTIIPDHILQVCKQKWTEISHPIDDPEAPALNWYEGVKFSSTDFASLMRKSGSAAWLTDNVLDFIGKMINNNPKTNSCFVFTTHLFDQYLTDKESAKHWVLSLLQSRYLLSIDKIEVNQLQIPINLRRNHWVLLVVQIDSAEVFWLDPYCPNNPTNVLVGTATDFVQWLKSIIRPISRVQFSVGAIPAVTLPTQPASDTWNCGVYTILMMMMFAGGNLKNIQDIPKYRAMIAFWCLTKTLPLEDF